MIYKSHSTLLYHVVYYLELLNGHGRAAGQNRQKNAKRLPLFIRVTCSVVSVYPCANKKIKEFRKKNKKNF